MAISPPRNITHTDIESFAAAGPMDMRPLDAGGGDACLLVTVDGIPISATPNCDCRGLLVSVELEQEEIHRLAFERPNAIRNAVYAVVNAMGEPLRLEGVGGCGGDFDPTVPPWFTFEAER